jgi:hypothetical protein
MQLHSANDQMTARVNMAFSRPQNYDSLQRTPKVHTNYKFLGLAHVQDIARNYAEQIKQLKLQVHLLYVFFHVHTNSD